MSPQQQIVGYINTLHGSSIRPFQHEIRQKLSEVCARAKLIITPTYARTLL